jgi:DNA-binding beta-propeller fold protein YncE
MNYSIGFIISLVVLLAQNLSAQDNHRSQTLLPTGVRLDPAGRSYDVGNMPMAMILSPGGAYLILSLSGWREQGIQIVERKTGRVIQTIAMPAAFLGLAFSPDGQTLYASGGNEVRAMFGIDFSVEFPAIGIRPRSLLSTIPCGS